MQREKARELYHEEVSNLENFKSKIDSHALFKEDLEEFSEQYEELVAQAKVITRVSDRLQKKLDSANVQIQSQNEEIKDKNFKLEDTIEQLAQAKVGRRASTIMLVVALLLFFMEQWLIQPKVEAYFSSPLISVGILIILFFLVKFLESALEGYFMNQQKKKIIKQKDQVISS
jgi:DNA repair exonuclease SbcCD ATPase subunit